MVPDWLPNWRDDGAYPDTAVTSREQWAWEFLRRNPAYQNDYEIYRCALSKSYNERSIQNFIDLTAELHERYEIGGLFDPANNAPDLTFFFNSTCPPKRMHKRGMPENPERYSPFQYYRFDLRLRIKPQLAAVKDALEFRQQAFRRIGKLQKEKRAMTTKYRQYLRVLDARRSGATHHEMAGTIYGVEFSDPDAKERQTVRDDLAAAEVLCTSDYRFIAAPKK